MLAVVEEICNVKSFFRLRYGVKLNKHCKCWILNAVFYPESLGSLFFIIDQNYYFFDYS